MKMIDSIIHYIYIFDLLIIIICLIYLIKWYNEDNTN